MVRAPIAYSPFDSNRRQMTPDFRDLTQRRHLTRVLTAEYLSAHCYSDGHDQECKHQNDENRWPSPNGSLAHHRGAFALLITHGIR